jgi:hypothetical protein
VSANVKRFRLSRASPPTAGTIRLVFAINSTPGSTTARSVASTTRGASRSFCSGPRRHRWRASRRPSGASCALPSRTRLAACRRLRAAVCARSSNSACCRWRVAPLAAHVPLVHDAALALRLSRRPLRQAAAPLQRAGAARREHQRLASQRDRVTHRRRCATCSTWLLRHYASDFLADSELFADCCAFLAQVRHSTRSRSVLSGNNSSDAAECVGEQQRQRRATRSCTRAALLESAERRLCRFLPPTSPAVVGSLLQPVSSAWFSSVCDVDTANALKRRAAFSPSGTLRCRRARSTSSARGRRPTIRRESAPPLRLPLSATPWPNSCVCSATSFCPATTVPKRTKMSTTPIRACAPGAQGGGFPEHPRAHQVAWCSPLQSTALNDYIMSNHVAYGKLRAAQNPNKIAVHASTRWLSSTRSRATSFARASSTSCAAFCRRQPRAPGLRRRSAWPTKGAAIACRRTDSADSLLRRTPLSATSKLTSRVGTYFLW